ncbi:transcriptional regulator [Stenotrophomonas maltophilia]|uniref:transcriptional regulator n=1 Tax=Stenotrophomonas maltophilia TaxID=40324 RepID=UPI0034D7436A
MNKARTMEEALAQLKGISLEVYRAKVAEKEKIRARGAKFRNVPPTEWPPLVFNWDISEASRCYVYDGVEPSEFSQLHPSGLALGYVDVVALDRVLCHSNRRDGLEELWKCGDKQKLCDVIAYLEAGLPITPPLVAVAINELCLTGGNHRYTAAKFSGELHIPIYVQHENVSAVESLVKISWVGA